MLNNLFVNKNNKTPLIRFPHFKGEYQLFQLKDIVKIQSGKVPNKENSSHIQNEIYPFPIVSGGTKITNYYKEYNQNENTITISSRGEAGYVSFQRKKFYLSNCCFSLKIINKKILIDYLYFYLKSKQEKLYLLQQTTSIPAINVENLKNIKIYVPLIDSYLSEQTKISDFLTLINQKIEIIQQQKEKIIQIKKYLLNKMFVND